VNRESNKADVWSAWAPGYNLLVSDHKPVGEGEAPDLRLNDLEHALHAVESEIKRYEAILRVSHERRNGVGSELERFLEFRDEILAKIRALSPAE